MRNISSETINEIVKFLEEMTQQKEPPAILALVMTKLALAIHDSKVFKDPECLRKAGVIVQMVATSSFPCNISMVPNETLARTMFLLGGVEFIKFIEHDVLLKAVHRVTMKELPKHLPKEDFDREIVEMFEFFSEKYGLNVKMTEQKVDGGTFYEIANIPKKKGGPLDGYNHPRIPKSDS